MDIFKGLVQFIAPALLMRTTPQPPKKKKTKNTFSLDLAPEINVPLLKHPLALMVTDLAKTLHFLLCVVSEFNR